MVRVGTFNLNNLFSRYNFQAEIGTIPGEDPGGITLTFESSERKVRTFWDGWLMPKAGKYDRNRQTNCRGDEC